MVPHFTSFPLWLIITNYTSSSVIFLLEEILSILCNPQSLSSNHLLLIYRVSAFRESTLHIPLSSQKTASTTMAHLNTFTEYCNHDSSIFSLILIHSSSWPDTKVSFSFLSRIAINSNDPSPYLLCLHQV